MILVAITLIIVMMMSFSPISVESLRTTMFLAILVWGFAATGLFIFGFGGSIFCGQRRKNEDE